MKLYPKTNNFLGEHCRSWRRKREWSVRPQVKDTAYSLSFLSNKHGKLGRPGWNSMRRGEPGQWMFYHTSNNGLHLHRQLTIVCTIHAIYCNHFFTFRDKPFKEDIPVRISELLAFQSWTLCYTVHWFSKSLNRLLLKPVRLKIANIQNNYWHSHFSSRFSAYIYNSVIIISIMSFKVQSSP